MPDIVPIPAVAPVTPDSPAAPQPASWAVPEPQIYNPTPEPEPAAAPAPEAPVAQTPDSPPAAAPAPVAQDTAEKRLRDTQRALHEKATEASQLRSRLTAIYNNPRVAAVLSEATATPTQPGADDPLAKAVEAYKAAPNDDEAIKHLLRTAQSLALTEVEARDRRRQAEAAVVAQNRAVANAVSEAVKGIAPDVPLRLFWSYANQAQAETPPQLQVDAERIEWQMNRAIDLARADLQPLRAQASQAATETTQLQRAASAVMPGGGPARPATSAPSAPNVSFVDQIKATQGGRRWNG